MTVRPNGDYLYVKKKKDDKIVLEVLLYDHSPVGIETSKKWLEKQLISNEYYITKDKEKL